MTTELDIIDTAVKIGLGALISGVATFFVTNSNNAHELRKEQLLRRLDLLEKIAVSTQNASTSIAKVLHIFYLSKEKPEEEVKTALQESLREYLAIFKESNQTDGYASLLGDKELEESLNQFNEALMDLYKFFISYRKEFDSSLNALVVKLNSTRGALPKVLSRVYSMEKPKQGKFWRRANDAHC